MTTTQIDIEKITSSREFWKLVYYRLKEIRKRQEEYIKELEKENERSRITG